jgi:hypothetical protein
VGPAPCLSQGGGSCYASSMALSWRTVNERIRPPPCYGTGHHTRLAPAVAASGASMTPTPSAEGDPCMAQTPSSPQHQKGRLRTYTLPGGWKVLVGRTDADNEFLRFEVARPDDWWFHIRGMSGSHVILQGPPGVDPDRETLQRAAAIAAYYSKARTAGVVAVSGTRVRTSASPGARKRAPCRSATNACSRSGQPLAMWPGSRATPRPNVPGVLRSRAPPWAPGRACRSGQRPQPPDRRGFLLGLRWFREGHELPKSQEGDPRGHQATECRHPAGDRGHQPVQQETQS